MGQEPWWGALFLACPCRVQVAAVGGCLRAITQEEDLPAELPSEMSGPSSPHPTTTRLD